MAARTDLPTLTEVIDLQKNNPGAYDPTAPMPIQDESVPLEDIALDALQSVGTSATGAAFATSTGDILEVSCYGPGVFRLRAGPRVRQVAMPPRANLRQKIAPRREQIPDFLAQLREIDAV